MNRRIFSHLILTAREDRNQDSPNHKRNGPKIRFDLSGYPILWWHPDRLEDFRASLEKEIRRRLSLPTVSTRKSPWDEDWLEKHRTVAKVGLQKFGRTGFMEIRLALSGPKPNKKQDELLRAARAAQTQPLPVDVGMVCSIGPSRPQAKADGIVAEIYHKEFKTYYYWALRCNGDFYQLMSFFEDSVIRDVIFANTRVARVAETLQYCTRLYKELGAEDVAMVHVGIIHSGLRGCKLAIPRNGGDFFTSLTTEDEVAAEIHQELKRIESNLFQLVKNLTAGLFRVFDYTELPDSTYTKILDDFAKGKLV